MEKLDLFSSVKTFLYEVTGPKLLGVSTRLALLILIGLALAAEFPWINSLWRGTIKYTELRHQVIPLEMNAKDSRLRIVLMNSGTAKADIVDVRIFLNKGQLTAWEIKSGEKYELEKVSSRHAHISVRFPRLAPGTRAEFQLLGKGLSAEGVEFFATADQGTSTDISQESAATRFEAATQSVHSWFGDGISTLRARTVSKISAITKDVLKDVSEDSYRPAVYVLSSRDFQSALSVAVLAVLAISFLLPGSGYTVMGCVVSSLLYLFFDGIPVGGLFFSLLGVMVFSISLGLGTIGCWWDQPEGPKRIEVFMGGWVLAVGTILAMWPALSKDMAACMFVVLLSSLAVVTVFVIETENPAPKPKERFAKAMLVIILLVATALLFKLPGDIPKGQTTDGAIVARTAVLWFVALAACFSFVATSSVDKTTEVDSVPPVKQPTGLTALDLQAVMFRVERLERKPWQRNRR